MRGGCRSTPAMTTCTHALPQHTSKLTSVLHDGARATGVFGPRRCVDQCALEAPPPVWGVEPCKVARMGASCRQGHAQKSFTRTHPTAELGAVDARGRARSLRRRLGGRRTRG